MKSIGLKGLGPAGWIYDIWDFHNLEKRAAERGVSPYQQYLEESGLFEFVDPSEPCEKST